MAKPEKHWSCKTELPELGDTVAWKDLVAKEKESAKARAGDVAPIAPGGSAGFNHGENAARAMRTPTAPILTPHQEYLRGRLFQDRRGVWRDERGRFASKATVREAGLSWLYGKSRTPNDQPHNSTPAALSPQTPPSPSRNDEVPVSAEDQEATLRARATDAVEILSRAFQDNDKTKFFAALRDLRESEMKKSDLFVLSHEFLKEVIILDDVFTFSLMADELVPFDDESTANELSVMAAETGAQKIAVRVVTLVSSECPFWPHMVQNMVIAAASARYGELCKTLYDLWVRDASPRQRRESASQLLFIASQANVPDLADYALSGGAFIKDVAVDGETIAHAAAKKGNVAVLQRIMCAASSDSEIVRAIDQRGRTPLHVASECGQTGAVAVLLSHGARVNAVDLQGFTPLHLASVRGDVATCNTLLIAGADVHARSLTGATATLLAAAGNEVGCIVDALLPLGGDMHARPRICRLRSTDAEAASQRDGSQTAASQRDGTETVSEREAAETVTQNQMLRTPYDECLLIVAKLSEKIDEVWRRRSKRDLPDAPRHTNKVSAVFRTVRKQLKCAKSRKAFILTCASVVFVAAGFAAGYVVNDFCSAAWWLVGGLAFFFATVRLTRESRRSRFATADTAASRLTFARITSTAYQHGPMRQFLGANDADQTDQHSESPTPEEIKKALRASKANGLTTLCDTLFLRAKYEGRDEERRGEAAMDESEVAVGVEFLQFQRQRLFELLSLCEPPSVTWEMGYRPPFFCDMVAARKVSFALRLASTGLALAAIFAAVLHFGTPGMSESAAFGKVLVERCIDIDKFTCDFWATAPTWFKFSFNSCCLQALDANTTTGCLPRGAIPRAGTYTLRTPGSETVTNLLIHHCDNSTNPFPKVTWSIRPAAFAGHAALVFLAGFSALVLALQLWLVIVNHNAFSFSGDERTTKRVMNSLILIVIHVVAAGNAMRFAVEALDTKCYETVQERGVTMIVMCLFPGQLLFTWFPAVARYAPTIRTSITAVVALFILSHSIEAVRGVTALTLPLWVTDPHRAFVAFHDSSSGQALFPALCLFAVLVALRIASSFLQQLSAATAEEAVAGNAEYCRKAQYVRAKAEASERFARIVATAHMHRHVPYRRGELDGCARATLLALGLHAAGSNSVLRSQLERCIEDDYIGDALRDDVRDHSTDYAAFYGVIPDDLVLNVPQQHPANFAMMLSSRCLRVRTAVRIARIRCTDNVRIKAEIARLFPTKRGEPFADHQPDERESSTAEVSFSEPDAPDLIVVPATLKESEDVNFGGTAGTPTNVRQKFVAPARVSEVVGFEQVPKRVTFGGSDYRAVSAVTMKKSPIDGRAASFVVSTSKNSWKRVDENGDDTQDETTGRYVLVRYARVTENDATRQPDEPEFLPCEL